jgi:type I restriction enzyme S subunit
MAETLFHQWFVEETKEPWEFVELGDYVNCFNGVSYGSEDLNPSDIAMITLKSFDRDGGFRLDGYKQFTGKHKEQHVVAEGELVVAHTDITQDAAVIGNPVLVVSDPTYKVLVISMDLVKVISKYAWLSNEFLYALMRTKKFKQHCLGYSNGSTVLHLNKQAIPAFEFFLPPAEKIKEFTRQAKDLFNKKFKNITQARTLEKLRDDLLPKLMSGEVKVAY